MSAVARSVLQQCISARLMVQPATGSEPAQYVEVSGNVVKRYKRMWENCKLKINSRSDCSQNQVSQGILQQFKGEKISK